MTGVFRGLAGSPHRGRVLDHQLNVVAALPVVGAQITSDVHGGAAALEQRFAQIGVQSAEGDGFQALPSLTAQDAADVVFTDNAGLDDAGVGQGEAGLGVAGTEGT